MAGLSRPPKALLASALQEQAESFDHDNELGLPDSFASQDQTRPYHALLSKLRLPFVIGLPILPIADPRNARSSSPGQDLSLSDFRRNPRKDIQSRMISPRTSNSFQLGSSDEIGAEDQDACSGSEFDLKDKREVAHDSRKESLNKLLLPLLGDRAQPFVLLCWGGEHECTVAPVCLTDYTDETAIWKDIRHHWYSRQGFWRRHIPCLCVRSIDIVEVVP